MDFETFAEKFERRYFCSIATIGAVAAGVSAVAGAASALSGGGSSGGGGGGSSGPAAYNPGSVNIASQNMPTQTDSQAAKSAYDPAAQTQAWSSIFTDFMHNGANPDTISMPKAADDAAPNVTPDASSS